LNVNIQYTLKYKKLPKKTWGIQGKAAVALTRLSRKAFFERTPTKHLKAAKIYSWLK
jgi:hypothetical protein